MIPFEPSSDHIISSRRPALATRCRHSLCCMEKEVSPAQEEDPSEEERREEEGSWEEEERPYDDMTGGIGPEAGGTFKTSFLGKEAVEDEMKARA